MDNSEGINWNDYFYYDETSPTFLRWKFLLLKENGQPIYQTRPGTPAGVRTGRRVDVRLHYKLYQGQRIVFEMHHGKIPDGLIVDHKDGDSTNNHIDNLRAVTQCVNTRNQSKRSTNRSGTTGVFRFVHKKSGSYWRAFWACPTTGKEERRDFSVTKYGEEGAYERALSLRAEKLEVLKVTAGYTEDHGKRLAA